VKNKIVKKGGSPVAESDPHAHLRLLYLLEQQGTLRKAHEAEPAAVANLLIAPTRYGLFEVLGQAAQLVPCEKTFELIERLTEAAEKCFTNAGFTAFCILRSAVCRHLKAKKKARRAQAKAAFQQTPHKTKVSEARRNKK
jgi:hypothetical protein